MTLDEMKLAVCEKLPELIEIDRDSIPRWRHQTYGVGIEPIKWPTEGLQVCHEAEKLLYPSICGRSIPWRQYCNYLDTFCLSGQNRSAAYEQRLEALCRVWWPERFTA